MFSFSRLRFKPNIAFNFCIVEHNEKSKSLLVKLLHEKIIQKMLLKIKNSDTVKRRGYSENVVR